MQNEKQTATLGKRVCVLNRVLFRKLRETAKERKMAAVMKTHTNSRHLSIYLVRKQHSFQHDKDKIIVS